MMGVGFLFLLFVVFPAFVARGDLHVRLGKLHAQACQGIRILGHAAPREVRKTQRATDNDSSHVPSADKPA
jgi:hypothetical protein